MPRIDATDVSLTFTVRQQKRISLKEYVVRGLFMGSSNPKVAVHALSGINLHLQSGDRVGVIGHNGAGKSTLLKTLAGIYPPTTGTYEVEGKICSLFDITLGFEMDANGWDNIRYRAYLQGETPATVKNKIDAIAEFSELGEFLNVPVRYYSSGMMMRLAFSIATVVDPEVLLIDEVLAVGDLAFQAKAQARMKEIMAAAGLMVLVSHDLGTVRNMCNRVLWLEHGRVRLEGDTEEVIAAYTAHATGQPVPAPVEAPALAAAA